MDQGGVGIISIREAAVVFIITLDRRDDRVTLNEGDANQMKSLCCEVQTVVLEFDDII